ISAPGEEDELRRSPEASGADHAEDLTSLPQGSVVRRRSRRRRAASDEPVDEPDGGPDPQEAAGQDDAGQEAGGQDDADQDAAAEGDDAAQDPTDLPAAEPGRGSHRRT